MNKQINIVLAAIITSFSYAQDVGFTFVKQMGGSSVEEGLAITTDVVGNIYSTGYFEGAVDFDPGSGNHNLTSLGGSDIYIQKLDPNGGLLWAKNFGGSLLDEGRSITVDSVGNVYTAGYFEGTVDFDPGVTTHNLTSFGSRDVFIQKLDANGNLIWAKHLGGLSSDEARSISLGENQNVYVSGIFQGTADFDPGASTSNLTSNGNADIFIVKLDTAGNFIWVKQIGGTSNDRSNMVTDVDGNVYSTGFFEGTVDFDPGAATNNLTSNGNRDVFIQKLDSLGEFVWAKGFGSSVNDEGNQISVDLNGNVYATGFFQSTVDFDPGAGVNQLTSNGSSDIFIQKLSNDGNFIWAKQMGGSFGDAGSAIATDSQGDLYCTGYFADTVDIDPGTGVHDVISNGDIDVFIQKLDSAGSFLWAKQFGGTFFDIAYAINVDNSNSIYTIGDFEDVVDFDPDTGVFNLTANGIIDVFIHKLSQCPSSYATINDTACSSYIVPSGDETYTTPGSYTVMDTIPNVCGSDSVITINLTVNSPSAGTDVQIACNSYTWIDGNTYTSSNSTATDTLINSVGCDSVVTLNLTINSASTGTDVQVACNSYTWIDGNTYTSSNSTATDTLTNSQGCDSIVTLNLTINSASAGTDVQVACNSYTWIDGNTYTSSNSTAMDTLINSQGCDSIVTLNLTINSASAGTDVQVACNSYTWIDGNTYTSSNSTATDTLTSSLGCDSVVTLNLTIDTLDLSVSQTGNLLTANETGGTYQWINCSDMTLINNAVNQSYTPTANGEYAVIITNNGCSDTSACYSATNVGIINNNFGDRLLVYPNPTSGNVSIDLGLKEEKVTITLTDLRGRIIQSNTYEESSIINVEIEESNGVYLLIVESDDKRAFIRLIKE